MRRALWLAATLLLAAAQARAQAPAPPTCWVVTDAKGYTMGSTEAGRYAAWWCPGAWGDWYAALLVMRGGYVLKHPPLASASPASVAEAYWRANVSIDCFGDINDPDVFNLCEAALAAARATRPLPPYIVRGNGSYATRPTYPVVAGVRGKTSNGSVPIKDAAGRPTPCNAAQTIKESGGTYMQVKRAVDTVALCAASSGG